jgi:hypothetical protein
MDYVAAVRKLLGQRIKGKFCYYTVTNQADNLPMVRALIWSMRQTGVLEDFHFFGPGDVEGAINHRWSTSRPWDHMQKMEAARDHLAELAEYDAVIFLDSDSWFLRDPGSDLAEKLLRQNRMWIQGESVFHESTSKHGDWWGCPVNLLRQRFAECGVNDETLYTTNGGMFVLRRDSIHELTERAFAIQRKFIGWGYPTTCDETALAVLNHLECPDVELSRKELTGDIWFCDWHRVWGDEDCPPKDVPIKAQDWLTKDYQAETRPAIVHLMRGKNWLRDFGKIDLTRVDQQQSAYPCANRGSVARVDQKPPCQGGAQPIFACTVHGECSLSKYCDQRTVAACSRCADRVA